MKAQKCRVYRDVFTKAASLMTLEHRRFSSVCRLLILLLTMAVRDDGWTKQQVIEDFTNLIDAAYEDN